MARRKKHKRHTGRRRRVGSAKNDGLMLLLGSVVGGVGSRFIASKLPTTINPKIIAVVQALGGAFIAWKVKNDFVKGIGAGVGTAGVIAAGQSFGFLAGIAGIGATDFSFSAPRKMGFPQVQRIGDAANSFPNPSSVGRSAVGDNIGMLIG